MDPSALDQLLQSKMHRELEIRRPFEPILRESEKKDTSLQVFPRRTKGIRYEVSDVPSVKEFKDYFQAHRAFLETCPDVKATRTQIKSMIQSYLTSSRGEKTMNQIHCIVKQLLQVMSDTSKERSETPIRGKSVEDRHDVFNIPFLAPRLHTLFSPIRRLASSRLRDIYSIGFDNQLKDCFVLKYPSTVKEGLFSSVHETVVSYQLNTLRSKTIGFQYGFGGFFCSMKEHLCDSKYPATFIGIYEYIQGKTLEKSLDSLSRTEFLHLLLQVGNVLRIGSRETKFRHNRLMSRNIILCEGPEKKMTVGAYRFSSTLQPVLTDFSHSIVFHAKQSKWITPSFATNFPIDHAEIEAPMWDIYVLLHSLMVRSYLCKLQSHLTLVSQILRWIQTQMKSVFLLEDLVKIQQFPYAEVQEFPDIARRKDIVEEFEKVTVEDWMKHIVSLC
jgi:hypothetical protein